jgi:hypothetical protein
MKKLLLILLCLPMIGFGQQTYVPDDNFEQALIYGGYDTVLDDYVTTANINTVTTLYLTQLQLPIFDLTGIEDFTLLHTLWVYDLYLTELDVSQNTFLSELRCNGNQLTCLDVSGCSSLYWLDCKNNFLTQLELSTNISLGYVNAKANPLLNCIQTVSNPTFTPVIDAGTDLNTNCSYGTILNCSGTTEIQEHTTTKQPLKITDLLGRETKQTNQPLFYIYDDGTVEKRIVIE